MKKLFVLAFAFSAFISSANASNLVVYSAGPKPLSGALAEESSIPVT